MAISELEFSRIKKRIVTMLVSYLRSSIDADAKEENCEKEHDTDFEGCLGCASYPVPLSLYTGKGGHCAGAREGDRQKPVKGEISPSCDTNSLKT